ncbi:pseudoazurin [uncultured Roseobacter sp.]|uniref:pseudoazurin n=1 Tax=uncultured Roseobacter sp. TaxID=114847 RepID=UPI00260B708B|nr:pseudoazurin [uncultured Roseobacter sp.]
MPMLTRMLCNAALALMVGAMPFCATAAEFEIQMLNAAPGNAQHTNVFAPAILRISSGDMVTFVPTDTGHNTASKRGMIPEGAEPWNSPMDTRYSVTLTVPGVYGYLCLPHYEMGMVGLIIVDDAAPNLESAKKIRHPGAARAAFRDLFDQLAN